MPISRFQKVPTGPTKNLERHYNRVVVRSFGWLVGWLVATLVIMASSHSQCFPADQTRPDQMTKMIKMIKMIKLIKMIRMTKMIKMIKMIKMVKMIKMIKMYTF